MTVHRFIQRWSEARVGERANFQSFMVHLCQILNVEIPDKDRPGHPDYGFEKPVRLTASRKSAALKPSSMDMFRRGCFVMEAKQSDRGDRTRVATRKSSNGWPGAVGRSMREAKLDAEDYAKGLIDPPPFIIAADVGRALELWANFSPDSGGVYTPFLVGGRHRIEIAQLVDPQVRATLARVWNDPWSLNPDRETVTADIAVRLGRLVQSIAGPALTGLGGNPDKVLRNAALNRACIFVSQCMFAMFLDSSGQWKRPAFKDLMEDYRDQPDRFAIVAADFFERLQRGGHCAEIRQDIPRFQRDIFGERVRPVITAEHLDVLIEAAQCDWSSAGPDLFGVLLEMIKDAEHRTEFGVHFTDRRLVEKVVQAAVMEPLRADWSVVEAQALQAAEYGDDRKAGQLIRSFHRKLCAVKVLDPACGTGNFLYVALGLMKALETEVLLMLDEVGQRDVQKPVRSGVRPGQFVGLEKDGATARIARLVMAIGQVQAHARSGQAVSSVKDWEGVDIRVQDALLVQDTSVHVARLAGHEVTARPWPEADFIVGNPPFLGGSVQRRVLGPAYVDALNDVREGLFRSADLATCWWDRAARILVRDGSRLKRFGFVLPAAVTQRTSREVLTHHLNGDQPMRLVLAIPDHPWTPLSKAAAVRVAVTVVERGLPNGQGRLLSIPSTARRGRGDGVRALTHLSETRGDIAPDLTIGLDIGRLAVLKANRGLASRGVQVNGAGFVVKPQAAARLLAQSAPGSLSPVKAYRNGRDLAERPRGVQVIDFFGWDEDRIRREHPGFHAHLSQTLKSERATNGRARYRNEWWLFGEPRKGLRAALQGLDRYIVTVEIGKHRWFGFLDAEIVADNRLVCVASDDPFILGVLSSRVHRTWSTAMGGCLEDRAIYTKTACFDRFAFPEPTQAQRIAISALAEALDRARGEFLARWPEMTMTGLYNHLDEANDDVGMPLPQQTEIARLRDLQTDLDRQVATSYGWPSDLSDAQILSRLVDLNLRRSNEESQGQIAWLRPGFQARTAGSPIRTSVARILRVKPGSGARRTLIPHRDGDARPGRSHAPRQELSSGVGAG